MLDFVGLIWNQLIIEPMVNSLVLLYTLLFGNFGLSILVFTVIIRLVTLPLTLKQIKMTRGMSQIQPQLKELQEKYKNDRQKVSQETLRLYREHGINPLGCLGPMFIQMPIWIGLYQAIVQTLPSQPERLMDLSQRLYSWLPLVHHAIPLSSQFLFMDLGLSPTQEGGLSSFVLPVMVGISMWAVQKTSTIPSADARQAQTNQMMLWMMPFMLTFFSFSLPSGLSLYWVASNLLQLGIQYFMTGWGNLLPSRKTQPVPQTTPAQPVKEMVQDGDTRSDGKVRRGSYRDRPRAARRRARPGRNRRP